MYLLVAVLTMLPSIFALLALLCGEPAADIGFGRRTVYAPGVLGFGAPRPTGAALRVPRGLELTPEGVRGVRGVGRIVLNWGVLAEASAMSTRSGSKLCLQVKSGEVNIVPRRLFGSDPDAVAAIINYYLRHRENRGHLTTPRPRCNSWHRNHSSALKALRSVP